jgi:light-regulated signal transduction histidine kinase (bacteriophytochrome)
MANDPIDLALASATAAPRFGQADLSNCEREQIHLPGSIQPHGALFAIAADLSILHRSSNAAAFLGIAEPSVGDSLEDIPGTLAARVREHLNEPVDDILTNFRCDIGEAGRRFDGLMHRTMSGVIFVELLHAASTPDLTGKVQAALETISGAQAQQELCNTAAALFYELTGYDRVVVYRFDPDGNGQVFAEKFEKDLEAYLGMRYPASDIPQIARRL